MNRKVVQQSKATQRAGINLTQDQIDQIKEAFLLFDNDGSGKINPNDLKNAMQNMNFQGKNPALFHAIVDIQGSNIDFDNFLDGVLTRLGNKQTRSGINKIFEFFDDDKTGTINLSNLQRVAKELGQKVDMRELEAMIDRAASNKKGITKQEFYQIMTKKTY